jgi:hypothetical protein
MHRKSFWLPLLTPQLPDYFQLAGTLKVDFRPTRGSLETAGVGAGKVVASHHIFLTRSTSPPGF